MQKTVEESIIGIAEQENEWGSRSPYCVSSRNSAHNQIGNRSKTDGRK